MVWAGGPLGSDKVRIWALESSCSTSDEGRLDKDKGLHYLLHTTKLRVLLACDGYPIKGQMHPPGGILCCLWKESGPWMRWKEISIRNHRFLEFNLYSKVNWAPQVGTDRWNLSSFELMLSSFDWPGHLRALGGQVQIKALFWLLLCCFFGMNAPFFWDSSGWELLSLWPPSLLKECPFRQDRPRARKIVIWFWRPWSIFIENLISATTTFFFPTNSGSSLQDKDARVETLKNERNLGSMKTFFISRIAFLPNSS